jgi:hypothetical protein
MRRRVAGCLYKAYRAVLVLEGLRPERENRVCTLNSTDRARTHTHQRELARTHTQERASERAREKERERERETGETGCPGERGNRWCKFDAHWALVLECHQFITVCVCKTSKESRVCASEETML